MALQGGSRHASAVRSLTSHGGWTKGFASLRRALRWAGAKRKGDGKGKGRHRKQPHLKADPRESGPWAVDTGMSREDVAPSLWNLATPSLRLWLQCRPSRLYSRRLHKAANSTGLLFWQPLKHKYLLTQCHVGMMSERVFCLRHHLLLAGLLNRTLVLQDLRQGPPLQGLYTWDLIFDSSRVQSCFGNYAIMRLKQFLRKQEARDWLAAKRSLIWSKSPQVIPQDPDVRAGTPEVADLHPDSPLSDWMAVYGGVQEEVLLVGDLFHAFWAMPDAPQLLEIGDAPFMRSASCPFSYFLDRPMDPESKMMNLVARFKKRYLSGPSYVAVHWQRSPTNSSSCSSVGQSGSGADAPRLLKETALAPDVGTPSLCGLNVDQVAGAIWRSLASTKAAKFVFIVTDASPEERLRLKEQLFTVENRVVRVRNSFTLLNKTKAYPAQVEQAEDVLNRLLCARAERFLGTYGTAFSLDVQRLRYGLGTATCRDQVLGDDFLSFHSSKPESTTVEMDYLGPKSPG